MAFGLSPKHVQEVSIDNLSAEQILIIAQAVAKKLDWDIGYINESGFVAYTKMSMSSFSEEFKIKINDKTATLKSECTGSQIMDWGKNKKNVSAFISAFNEVKLTFSDEELARRYEELKPSFGSTEQAAFYQAPLTTKEKLSGIFSVFKPAQGYFITPVLININIAIFIAMVVGGVNAFMPDGESLVSWGANFRPATLNGEWWRLFTCCFLHIGMFHLLMNMYALFYIGLLIEPHLGKSRFLATYVLTGVAASATSLWWHDVTISAGASGAIFGMYGVFLAMLTTNLIEKSARKALLTSIAVFVGYNLLNGLKDGIDNAAHIGGLVSGIVVGYCLIPSLKRDDDMKLKYALIAVLSATVVLGSLFVYKNITPYEMTKYQEKMKAFVTYESMALEMFKMPEDTPNEKVLHEIETRSLYYWNKSIDLINEVDDLNLPRPIHARNNKILEYCELRVENCNLIYKAIEEDTDKYRGQIEGLNKQIETIMKELSGRQ